MADIFGNFTSTRDASRRSIKSSSPDWDEEFTHASVSLAPRLNEATKEIRVKVRLLGLFLNLVH